MYYFFTKYYHMECQDNDDRDVSTWSLNETNAKKVHDLLINKQNSTTAVGWIDQISSKFYGNWKFE